MGKFTPRRKTKKRKKALTSRTAIPNFGNRTKEKIRGIAIKKAIKRRAAMTPNLKIAIVNPREMARSEPKKAGFFHPPDRNQKRIEENRLSLPSFKSPTSTAMFKKRVF